MVLVEVNLGGLSLSSFYSFALTMMIVVSHNINNILLILKGTRSNADVNLVD